MARTKISEFSATANSNTDIDGINLAEGCAPSGINDAIRELMAQLKDFQAGTAGDSFNGPVGTTTAAAGAFTTLTTSSAVTHNGGTANGVAYLNGSKVLTTGSALTFNGTNLGIGTASPGEKLDVSGRIKFSDFASDVNDYAFYVKFATGLTIASPNAVVFRTDSAERARFNATGALVLQGGNASANGVGITFPATQSASSDANTLDDYEEGTWTGSLIPDVSGSITVNSSYDTLSYTKVGRLVTITGRLQISSVSSPNGNVVRLQNLPFTNASGSEDSSICGINVVMYNGSNYVNVPAYILSGSLTLAILTSPNSVTSSYLFFFSFSYTT